jgi:hypothetical protein
MSTLHRTIRSLTPATVLAIVACQTTPYVDRAQPEAVQVATRRAQFELNCPQVNTEVISREKVVPPVAGPRFSPPERAEYTVGVSGCGKRHSYLVTCTEGAGGCVAAGGREER